MTMNDPLNESNLFCTFISVWKFATSLVPLAKITFLCQFFFLFEKSKYSFMVSLTFNCFIQWWTLTFVRIIWNGKNELIRIKRFLKMSRNRNFFHWTLIHLMVELLSFISQNSRPHLMLQTPSQEACNYIFLDGGWGIVLIAKLFLCYERISKIMLSQHLYR